MARCYHCGRSGLFFKVDAELGMCPECIDQEYYKAKEIYNDILKAVTTLRGNNLETDYAISLCDTFYNMISAFRKNPLAIDVLEDNIIQKSTGTTELRGLGFYVGYNYSNLLEDTINRLKREQSSLLRKWTETKHKHSKYASFNEQLIKIPIHDIVLTDEKYTRLAPSDLDDIKFSSISKSSNYERLSNFIVIDVETTGLSPSKNEIIELSAIKFEEWEPVSKFQTLIKPKHPIPEEITKINGISQAMVENSPSIHQVMASFIEYIGDKSTIIGHNLLFDMKFLWSKKGNISIR